MLKGQGEGVQTYRRRLNDSDSFNNLFLVHLRTWTVKVSDDGSHASFVSHSCGQVDWLLGIVLGKALDLDIALAEINLAYEPNLFTLPRCLLARFRGRKAKEP